MRTEEQGGGWKLGWFTAPAMQFIGKNVQRQIKANQDKISQVALGKTNGNLVYEFKLGKKISQKMSEMAELGPEVKLTPHEGQEADGPGHCAKDILWDPIVHQP